MNDELKDIEKKLHEVFLIAKPIEIPEQLRDPRKVLQRIKEREKMKDTTDEELQKAAERGASSRPLQAMAFRITIEGPGGQRHKGFQVDLPASQNTVARRMVQESNTLIDDFMESCVHLS